MQLPEALYIAGYALQAVSYLLMVEKVSRKGSVLGLSSDFVTYSWLWFASNVYYGAAYLVSSFVIYQYANRYPEYPTYYTSKFVLFIDCVGMAATSGLIYQNFRKYRATRKGNESLSMLFYFVLLLLGSGLVWLLWKYARGKETLSELDIANYCWLMAYVGFSFRLFSQCSNNWYFSRVHIMHKNFMLVQTVSLCLMTVSLLHYKLSGIQWYDLPTNIVSAESLLLNWICMAVLLYQKVTNNSSKTVLAR